MLAEKEEISYGGKNQQDKIIDEAIKELPKRIKDDKAESALLVERRKTTDGKSVSYLEHHLRQYTRRNTSDFFIHKDLKGFLEKELDFYLKNEVLNIDELEAAGKKQAQGWFQTMLVIKNIGHKIITFLAQIENFQKKLFEKKKLVTETQYCITIASVPEKFYEQIAQNDAQWAEWKELFAIDEEQKNLFNANAKSKKGRRIAFLKAHPTLMVDTNHFDAGVGDGFERNSPAWIETVKKLRRDFPVYGSIIECAECLTRLIGQENTMLWIGLYPGRMGKVINRIGQFYLDCAKGQIQASDGLLDGFVIWGDVAYKRSMFFSPDYWREYFKPWVRAIADYAHSKGLMVIYHGCGNINKILEDYIEIGIDALNPLEAKADMDVVELRKKHGHKMGFFGNSNIQIWETGDKELIRKEVLRKLNAAKGGGYIFASDHSVAGDVSGHTYDYIVKLVREYGQYPLKLGEFDEKI